MAEFAASAGALWVGTHRVGTVSRIDPQTNAVVATVNLSFDSASSLAAADGSVWVGVCTFGATGLVRIDAATSKIVATIAGPNACGVAAGDSAVWVADTIHDAAWRIDPATNAVVAKISVGTGALPGSVVSAFGSVWIADVGNGTVSRIDPTSNAIVATIHVGASAGSNPAVADGAESITAGGGSIWVGNDLDNKVYKIDPASNGVVTVEVGAVDRGNWRVLTLSFGMGSLWARTAACEVAQIDPVTASVTKRIALCTSPETTANVAAAFNSLWVAYPESGHVRRLQP